MSKHTPGPWTIGGSFSTENIHPALTIESPFGQVAAIVAENCDDDDQVYADARLIAAAPDLLESLVRVEARLTAAARAFYGTGKRSALQEAFRDWKEDAELARAAIAKATGE